MRVIDNGPEDAILVQLEEGDSSELKAIAQHHMPEWLRLFAKKNADYGSGSAFELGERGQYSDIHRKMIKLKRAMWDGEELGFEDTDEIIKDLIGHLFLTLHMRGMKEEAARVYAYSEDDAAVDAIFRMVDNDASKAYQLSYGLTPPFGDLVRARASKAMEDEAREEMARRCSDPSLTVDAATERLKAAGMADEYGRPRLMSRAQLIHHTVADNFASEEFGAADQAQGLPDLRAGDIITVTGLKAGNGDYVIRSVDGPPDLRMPSVKRPARDDDPVHPQDAEDDGPPAYIDAIPEPEDDEDGHLLNRLGAMVDGVTDEVLKGEAKAILDKLFKNSDKQRELLSKFERKIRGY